MSHGNTEEMLKHVKIYIMIFVALAVLTLVTVWVSQFQFSHTMHIVVALSIATLKGALVALFFMHLIEEKKVIYGILIFTVAFFFVLMLVTWLTDYNMLRSGLFH